MQKGKLWTDKENLFLKKYYPTKGSKYIAEELGRTRAAVITHAHKIGISGTGYLPYHQYSPAEIIFIKKYYPLYGSRYVGQKLGRSPSSIKDKARRLRVERRKFIDWNKYEIEYLKKWYKKKRPSKIARHLERSTPAIIARARKLGLLVRITRKWNIDEERFLIKNFRKMTYKEMGKQLGRTPRAVGAKANAMLTMRKINTRKWETKEKRLLGRLYGKISVTELAARLNRTTHSVLHQAKVQKKSAKGAPVYSAKEINFILDNYLKMTNVEISKKLKRPQTSIAKIAGVNGLSGNPDKRRIWKRGIRKESGYNYSEVEKEFIRRNYLNMTNVQIAKKLNRTVNGILTMARKLGLTGNPQKTKLGHSSARMPSARNFTEKEKKFISKNYLKMTNKQIGKELKRHPGSIQRILRELGLSGNPEKLKISKTFPYSDQEKEFIRENYFKMTNTQIGLILNRPADSIQIMARKLGLSGNPEKIQLWYDSKRKH
jgi:hypothetical protein